MRKKSAYKIPTHKIENHIKVDNKYYFNKSDTTMAKKFRKNIVHAGFNEESNRSEADVSQSTHQINTNASKSTLSAIQRGKHCIINTFIRVTRKKKLLNIIKIRNPSKSLLPKYTKVIERHKIATSIDNMVKELVNIRESWTELTERAIKLLVSICSHNKYLLLSILKLLRDERNVSIFLFFTGKIQRDWLYEECKVAYEEKDKA